MLSSRRISLRGCALVLAGLGGLLMQSSSADAGAFFHRMLGRQRYQQCYQQVPVQAAPATSAAPSGSYQSNSFEPGASAPVMAPAPVAAPRYVAPSNRPSHEQFRGDRKALGRY